MDSVNDNPGEQFGKRLVIRNAVDSDIPGIHRLYKDWETEGITYGFFAPDKENIRTSLGPYFLLAETNGMIVGLIAGSARVSEGLAVIPEGEGYLEIDDLYVTAEHRHNQIGSRLIDQLLASAKKDGIEQILVYSASKDVHSILRFYESHGFDSWYIQLFRKL